MSYIERPSWGTAQNIGTFFVFAIAIALFGSSMAAIGSLKVLPMPPRSAFHPNGSAESELMITPEAPPPSAARIIAPTLPASWTLMGNKTGPEFLKTCSTRMDLNCPRAIDPEGDLVGLIADNTGAETENISVPVLFSCSRILCRRSSAFCNTEIENTAVSMRMPDCKASSIRRDPSSRRCRLFILSDLAADLNAVTIGFRRLVILFTGRQSIPDMLV